VTRRDYVRIAGVLSRFANLTTRAEAGAVTAAIADALANAFKLDNPRFDRDRFLAAIDVPARYFESPREAA
jgi:hypothetical protein